MAALVVWGIGVTGRVLGDRSSRRATRPAPPRPPRLRLWDGIFSDYPTPDLTPAEVKASITRLIRETLARVNVRRLRGQYPCVPEPGCQLFDDDAVDGLLSYAPSKLAFGALQSARDHLGAFHDHIEHGSLHPFADRTLLRTAIASAANAVWVLEPNERTQRVMRARMLALETASYHLGFLENLTTHMELSTEDRDHNEKLFSAASQTRDTLNEIRRRDGQTQ